MTLVLGAGLVAALVFVTALARLFSPPKRVMPSSETNWEQRNDLASAENSPDVTDSVSPVDVAIGLQLDSGGAH